MPHVSDFLAPAELQKISNLQIVARLVVEGFFSGLHKSPHKGFSVEFAQHRQYVQGDEIRRLDWKVFGKTDRFYIREFEEETNLRATLLLDLSGSMDYGSARNPTKQQYATRLAAALAYLMLQQRDTVGLVTFDSRIRRYIPQRSGVGHLRVLMEELQQSKPGGETALAQVFAELVPRIHRRGLLVILSDCFGDVKQLVTALAQFRHARHEILLFQILDRDEVEFPFRRWTKFESLEQAEQFRLIEPAQFRTAYLENLRKFQDELTQGCHRHRIDLVQMITDQPYADALATYLTKRLARG
ncbi:MAG: DUF58 domain-containing protein [Verrucomicrobia bacterium]|nr:DUF58 domain-containing protein [Verrucomicrobiota bacterium]